MIFYERNPYLLESALNAHLKNGEEQNFKIIEYRKLNYRENV